MSPNEIWLWSSERTRCSGEALVQLQATECKTLPKGWPTVVGRIGSSSCTLFMRMWCNGSHAGLRSQCREGVKVRVLSSVPSLGCSLMGPRKRHWIAWSASLPWKDRPRRCVLWGFAQETQSLYGPVRKFWYSGPQKAHASREFSGGCSEGSRPPWVTKFAHVNVWEVTPLSTGDEASSILVMRAKTFSRKS